MKPLILTNHCLEQYSARTGRDVMSCVAELINSIRTGKEINFTDIEYYGFNIHRIFNGDKYYLWYDPKIDDDLLAIVAKDGAVKTVLRREMYSHRKKVALVYDKTKGGYRFDTRHYRKKSQTTKRMRELQRSGKGEEYTNTRKR